MKSLILAAEHKSKLIEMCKALFSEYYEIGWFKDSTVLRLLYFFL